VQRISILCFVAATLGGCAPDDDPRELGLDEDEELELDVDRTATDCKKTVKVHIANWGFADALNDDRADVAPNGCWAFNRAHRWGHYWAHCKGASNKGSVNPGTWVVNWGSPGNWEPDALKMWVYNETRKDRSPYPSDSERIDNCWAHLVDHWDTTPAKGYEYMTYQGQSGWFKSGNDKIVRSFAELYGIGTWWPFWNQWKENPVGRPMASIVDANQHGNAHTVTKGMCDYVSSGNWIGLWIPSDTSLTYDSPAFEGIVQALNECTE
jgi:hypothetical protein